MLATFPPPPRIPSIPSGLAPFSRVLARPPLLTRRVHRSFNPMAMAPPRHDAPGLGAGGIPVGPASKRASRRSGCVSSSP
jgi:hypothetical protein